MAATDSLLPPPRGARPEALLKNFTRMSIFFSINHGCVTAVLNLSVVLLGQRAGSFQTGALYVMYAVTALLLSTMIIAALGMRRALITGASVYCLYVVSLPLALIFSSNDEAKYAIALVGGGVGGIAAGFLWAAQGAYFATTTQLYSAAKAEPAPIISAKLAATFGGIFLLSEVIPYAFPSP